MERAIVLLSGGQDSTTSLFWALSRFDCVALTISYGQRHSIEVESAKKIADMVGIEWSQIHTDLFQTIGNSALVDDKLKINDQHNSNENLPASFVPGRNLIFITIAAMYGYREGIENIVTGVCQADSSGYPDCRFDTIKSLRKTLYLGIGLNLKIHTPLMTFSKAEAVNIAYGFEGCFDALAYSHTCYEGKYPPCGECPACKLRAKGFAEARITDPLIDRYNVEKTHGRHTS